MKSKQRSLSYNRAVGCLHVRQDGKETGYFLDALPHDFGAGVKCFRVTKIIPPTDGTPDHYDVRLEEGGAHCECRGFLRWGHCKHSAALRLLVERGSL